MTIVNYDWDEEEDNIVEEYDDGGTTVAEYTTEPNLYGNVISQRRSDQDSYFHYDGQGSTLALTNAQGDVTDTYAYSSYGEVTEQSGSTVFPFQFIGQNGYYYDLEIAQYAVRRRVLAARTGRWLAVDPVLSRQSINLYLYVDNSPGLVFDPSGTEIQVIPGAQNLGRLDCGETASIQWVFVLKPAAICDGYLIQQVSYYCEVDDTCTKCPMDIPKKPLITFWEAFRVRKDKDRERVGDGKGKFLPYTDEARATAIDKTCGIKKQFGAIRFYCEDPKDSPQGVGTGDLGQHGINPTDPNSPWKIDRTYGSGNCSVTTRQPTVGTDQPIAGQDNRGRKGVRLEWR